MEYVRGAYHAVTSKTAQRTLLNTVLITTASAVLCAFSIVGFLLFYHNYLPDQVTTVPVHLQYGDSVHPYGIASLGAANLKDVQAYDISVTLALPRSPPNLNRGNFMIALHLLESSSGSSGPAAAANSPTHPLLSDAPGRPFVPPDSRAQLADRTVLYSSTRPALVPYTDPLVSLASHLALLPYHMAFPREAETVTLEVPLAERVIAFPRGAARPVADVLVELQAGQDLQVYSVAVTLTARLTGLRYLLHHYRVASFIILTTGFWACEVFIMLAVWVVLSLVLGGGGGGGQKAGLVGDAPTGFGTGGAAKVKTEPEEMSDTERTFPSLSNQPPLKYESRAVKTEEPGAEPLANMPPAVPGAEADDEEEVDYDELGGHGSWRDSGIGTSYSEHTAGETVRRRSAKGGRAQR